MAFCTRVSHPSSPSAHGIGRPPEGRRDAAIGNSGRTIEFGVFFARPPLDGGTLSRHRRFGLVLSSCRREAHRRRWMANDSGRLDRKGGRRCTTNVDHPIRLLSDEIRQLKMSSNKLNNESDDPEIILQKLVLEDYAFSDLLKIPRLQSTERVQRKIYPQRPSRLLTLYRVLFHWRQRPLDQA
jgi:hypothetical protein